jgi:sec-independent protein translocase protein TatC
MTFFEHLDSLRKQLWLSVIILLLGFGISLYFYNIIIELLTAPLKAAVEYTGSRLYLTTVYEGFMARIKIALISGLVLTLPLHLINLLTFIFPALTSRERKITAGVLTAGFVISILSLYYGYRYLIPFSINFLTGTGFSVGGTSFLLGFTKNIFYLIQFFTAVVIIFQLPLILILLISLRVITISSAFKSGRYIIVAAFILSAILTPPDIVSQIMTALPLILLYYLSLMIAKILRLGEL